MICSLLVLTPGHENACTWHIPIQNRLKVRSASTSSSSWSLYACNSRHCLFAEQLGQHRTRLGTALMTLAHRKPYASAGLEGEYYLSPSESSASGITRLAAESGGASLTASCGWDDSDPAAEDAYGTGLRAPA